jgi:hypothetical protein
MWVGKDSKTAPFDLKRVLGAKIARFNSWRFK